ncbi:uncharacterized protein LOC110682754 isoform X1 [Chenopodium quinoa]|uniref:uncharacterized protein LOC110682754 isoform X1 n=1 Tax=Chenopodium quinoa TaxID=63459 RepID=UPI000B785657|nr:uncharacterized protein LOC110682754 isoform X1 [Chenopodium quinoa]
MPNTTARVKGLFIPFSQTSQTVPEEESSRGCRIRGVGVQHSDGAGVHSDDGTGVHSDDGSCSETDGEYMLEGHEDKETESEGEDTDPDEVEENVADLLNQNYVDGGWEPFRCNEKFYELDGGYISKMYNNGEVYDDAEMGRIALRPWKMFVDRDHFKDALRDFCIQEGFSLVVRRQSMIDILLNVLTVDADGEYMQVCF